jgi:phosphatidylglycerophosphate synthase
VNVRASPTRHNNGLLFPLERPTLAFLAARAPGWVTPDRLTAVGVVGAVTTFCAYTVSAMHPAFLWLATLGLAINWLGDSLDGTLARFRGIERPRYGYYLDNAIDCIAALLLAGGIALSGYVRADLCFLALAAYTMLSALTFLRATVSGVFQISYGPIGPTETRLVFAAANALLFFVPPVPFQLAGFSVRYPDLLSLAWSALMIVTFVICAANETRRLSIEEPARQTKAQKIKAPLRSDS